MTIYKYSARRMSGEEQSLRSYEGQVLLIVNTATKCGFTPQLRGLETLYRQFHERGFSVLGFPCNQFGKQEPGSNAEVEETCQLNYGVRFPMFQKVDVKGAYAEPLFRYLTTETKGIVTAEIKWNFTKFLVDRKGEVVKRYAPMTKPDKIAKDIVKLLER